MKEILFRFCFFLQKSDDSYDGSKNAATGKIKKIVSLFLSFFAFFFTVCLDLSVVFSVTSVSPSSSSSSTSASSSSVEASLGRILVDSFFLLFPLH